jgi:peroxiredoxin
MSICGAGAGLLVLRAGSEGSVDGSCGSSVHQLGMPVSAVSLQFAPGEALPGSMMSLADLVRHRWLVVIFYGGLVLEGVGDGGQGMDVDLEGVRMDGWREREPELEEFGYDVVGVSSQSSEVQAEFALDRMLSFTFLSDSELLLADKLGLPTRTVQGGERVYMPSTIIVQEELIVCVFHPVDPVRDAMNVRDWIRSVHA